MSRITWDGPGEKKFETGVDHGVLFIPDATGAYVNGYPWNGLVSVAENPSGAEANKQYADNIAYLNIKSAEEFGATVEAFTYPPQFEMCDGTAVVNGVRIGQQARRSFGFSYRTLVGNDLEGQDHGEKIHLVYGCDAAPSEKTNNTVNESPEAATLSWEFTTTPVAVEGTNPVTGKDYRPTAHLTIDSTDPDVTEAKLNELKDIIYGTAGVDPRMPTPTEVLAMFAGTVTEVTPTAPTFDSGTDTITIPTVTGVTYYINGAPVTGAVVITEDTVVTARPNPGYKFPAVTDDDWLFEV